MNKFRVIGVGTIFTGILISYFLDVTHIHILSGMLIGIGGGWTITGKIGVHPKRRQQPVRTRVD